MKKMNCTASRSIRDIVRFVNENNLENPNNPIQKDDIVSIIKGDGLYLFVYFN